MLLIIFVSFLFLLIFGYFYLKYKFNFWKRHGFSYVEPDLFYGNVRGMGTSEFQAITMDKLYKKLKGNGPIAGMYFFTEPTALVVDYKILKYLLVKDFQYFHDRGLFTNEKVDPLSGHLFALGGERWRQIRTKVTPTFTSGKMKAMYSIILDVTKNFDEYMSEIYENGMRELEVKDLFCRLTTDMITSCAFGIELNTLRDEHSQLRDLGKHIFHSNFLRNFYLMAINLFRNAARLLRLRFIEKIHEDYFIGMIRDNVEYRERNNYQRNDFINLLIQLKNHGMIDDNKLGHLTMNEVAAMCFTFFLAGFETSSNVLTFCLYELSLAPDIQSKLRDEVENVLKNHDNKLTYECAMAMTYLDQIIKETLRKWPSVSNLMRVTKEDYKIPGTDLTLPKDTWVIIPIYSVHRDPDVFPNPDDFNPENFSVENESKRSTFEYLPFGEGPRNCLGIRFGFMEVRLTLISLITKYRFILSPKTKTPIELLPQVMAILAPKGGMWIRFERLEKPISYET